jgi:hypothetical protein
MVLTATAIPIELRPFGSEPIDFGIGVLDVLLNIALYLPVGIVLGKQGPARATVAAALISTFAELSQFVIVHRVPLVIDVPVNELTESAH